MNAAHWIVLSLLGGAGAVARIDGGAAVARRVGSVAIGTLTVNLIGAFALGVVTGLDLPDGTRKVLAIGFIGAFTTFSTWMVEAERHRSPRQRAALLVGALILGLLAVTVGRAVGNAL